MADANPSGDVVITEPSEDGKQDTQESSAEAVPQSVDTSPEEVSVEQLKADLARAEANLAKARKGEKYHKQSREELEQRLQSLEDGNWQARAEQAETQLRNIAVDGALGAEVAKHFKPESQKLLMKALESARAAIDVKDGVADAKAVEALMLKAKEEFPEHAITVDTPAPKRAAEGAVTGGYAKEMAAAKSIEEIEAIARRYAVGR
jgi:hypothetical protein